MPIKHELIIAGANKCGTTSVFRYLAEHPSVCAASRKETGFFHRDRNYSSPEARQEFEALFPGSLEQHEILLEATPNYLDRGERSASRLKALLRAPRILFLLRDPVERFLSRYRSRRGVIGDPATRLSPDEFCVAQLEAADADPEGAAAESLGIEDLLRGRYATPLRDYIEVFRAGEVSITFYDDLAADPRAYMRRLSEWLEIDPGFYDDFVFRVENRSRPHRSHFLRTFASRTNLRLEPLLNRLPAVRRSARAVYNAINTGGGRMPDLAPETRVRLGDYYAGSNAALRELLHAHYPGLPTPSWLQ